MRIPSVSLLLPGALILAACGGEQSRPATRDLTLLAPATESGAVVSAREMAVVRTEKGVDNPAAARPVNKVSRMRVSRASDAAAGAAPAPAPAPDNAAPAAPAEEATQVAAGAGRALEPGQTVTAIPATSGGISNQPGPDPYDGPVVDRRRPQIHDGDRCIPGRGEVMPRGPVFPGRPSVPNGFRMSRLNGLRISR